MITLIDDDWFNVPADDYGERWLNEGEKLVKEIAVHRSSVLQDVIREFTFFNIH